jgi:hypothetical protein
MTKSKKGKSKTIKNNTSNDLDIILKEAEITAKEADITALKLLVSVTANFTTAQREELDYFTKVDTFQNNNI